MLAKSDSDTLEKATSPVAIERASAWVRAQYDTTAGAFRFAPETAPNLLGTCCAVLATELYDQLDDWPLARREATAGFIQGFQSDQGWFEVPDCQPDPAHKLSGDYLRGHATFLAMMALNALGHAPSKSLAFLDQWRDSDRLYEWIDQLDWKDPWRESNWVEWIGYWLLAEARITTADVPLTSDRWPAGFAGILGWLEDHQDPETGFWGNPPYSGAARVLHQMAAAYHHYVFLYAAGRPIRHLDRIVDLTLDLQQPDGLFLPGRAGGGPCEDLDAMDILANMHRLADYRRTEIERALTTAALALLRSQQPNGAFVYCANRKLDRLAGSLQDFRKSIRKRRFRSGIDHIVRGIWHCHRGRPMYYAGCPALPFRAAGGDMFSQWFRPLAIGCAAKVLGPSRAPCWWRVRSRPQITQGWFLE